MFLVWSCSEGPAPGPMSPSGSASKRTLSPQSATGTVRPVQRLANRASHSLAKSGYNRDKVLHELEIVRDEMQAIVDNNPFSSVAGLLSDAVRRTDDAARKLENPTWGGWGGDDWDDDKEQDDDKSDKKALVRIKKAKDKIQEAINRQLLLPAQGNQFLGQLIEIENQINNGYSAAHDYRGQSKSLWIKRSYGGMIKFAGHSIDVPKYATKQDAEFSINISPNDYITVDFGPDGWFDQQVTVTISYKDADLTGVDPSKLTLAWYDESTGQWVDLGGVVDLVHKTVTAKAWHFTQYTISTK